MTVERDEINRSMKDVIALSEVHRRDPRTGKIEDYVNSVEKKAGAELGKWGGPAGDTGSPALNKFYAGYNSGHDDFGAAAAKGMSDAELSEAHDHLGAQIASGTAKSVSPQTDLRVIANEQASRATPDVAERQRVASQQTIIANNASEKAKASGSAEDHLAAAQKHQMAVTVNQGVSKALQDAHQSMVNQHMAKYNELSAKSEADEGVADIQKPKGALLGRDKSEAYREAAGRAEDATNRANAEGSESAHRAAASAHREAARLAPDRATAGGHRTEFMFHNTRAAELQPTRADKVADSLKAAGAQVDTFAAGKVKSPEPGAMPHKPTYKAHFADGTSVHIHPANTTGMHGGDHVRLVSGTHNGDVTEHSTETKAMAHIKQLAQQHGGLVSAKHVFLSADQLEEAVKLSDYNNGTVIDSPGSTDSPVHADKQSVGGANTNATPTGAQTGGNSAASAQQRADTGAGIHGNPQTPTNTDDLTVGSPAWEGLRNLLQNSTDLFVTAPSLGQPFTDLIGAANAENLGAAKVALYRLFAAAGQRYTNALIDDAVRQIASTVNDLPLYAGEDMDDSPDVPEDTLQDIVADNDPDNDKDRAASNTYPQAGTQNSNTVGTYLSAASETAKAAAAFLLKLSTPEQVANAGTPGDPRMMTNAANQAGVDATTKNPVMKCPAGHDAPQGGWGDMKYCPQDGKKLVKVKPDTSNDGKSETESDAATASAAASSGTVAASNAEIDRLVALSRK